MVYIAKFECHSWVIPVLRVKSCMASSKLLFGLSWSGWRYWRLVGSSKWSYCKNIKFSCIIGGVMFSYNYVNYYKHKKSSIVTYLYIYLIWIVFRKTKTFRLMDNAAWHWFTNYGKRAGKHFSFVLPLNISGFEFFHR